MDLAFCWCLKTVKLRTSNLIGGGVISPSEADRDLEHSCVCVCTCVYCVNINMCAPVLMCVLWEHASVYNCVNVCCMDMYTC